MQYKEKKREKNTSLLWNDKTGFVILRLLQPLHINILQWCSIVAMPPQFCGFAPPVLSDNPPPAVAYQK